MAALLFLTPQLPYPPRQGTAIRNWGLIRHLARRHSVSLLSFVELAQAPKPDVLRRICQPLITLPVPQRSRVDRIRTLLSGQADLVRRLWSPEFEQALTQMLAMSHFDAIHIEGLEMAAYLSTVLAAAPKSKIIYDAHNAEHLLQRRAFRADLRHWQRWPAAVYSWLQAPRLARLEAAVCQVVDGVACVSREDGAALQSLVPTLSPLVVPNGIDQADFADPGPLPAVMQGERDTLVFTGKMDYRPNVDAAHWLLNEILPRVRAVRPNVRCLIVGQKPTASLVAHHNPPSVVITGAVDDTRPYIGHAAVYVAPLRMGGGTRFKLLEAMALARPIVSTTLGAEGFAVQSGRELLLADTSEALAAAIVGLLENPTQASALAIGGKKFVEADYDWANIVPRLETLYQ